MCLLNCIHCCCGCSFIDFSNDKDAAAKRASRQCWSIFVLDLIFISCFVLAFLALFQVGAFSTVTHSSAVAGSLFGVCGALILGIFFKSCSNCKKISRDSKTSPELSSFMEAFKQSFEEHAHQREKSNKSKMKDEEFQDAQERL